MDTLIQSLILTVFGKVVSAIIDAVSERISAEEEKILPPLKKIEERLSDLEQLRKLRCWDCPLGRDS
jgi:hypothetical protein